MTEDDHDSHKTPLPDFRSHTVSTMASTKPAAPRERSGVSIWILLCSNLLIFQLCWLYPTLKGVSNTAPIPHSYDGPIHTFVSPSTSTWNRLDPLSIPYGQAVNLPSIRVEEESIDRKFYGGAGDKAHLGGFTELDPSGISPTVWSRVITEYGVRSFLDVGCGKGVSTRWFLEHGADVLCVEGSHDAVMQSFLPADRVVEHDFSRGPWWPGKTYDMAWSVEFLEHVSRQYHFNYISTFRKAALIFVTSSRWGGWHHVEVHPNEWWIRKFESYGFRYDEAITEQVKNWARQERTNSTFGRAPNGAPYGASHITTSLKVFVNPVVAALPEHAHLFPRDGCFHKYAPPGSAFKSLTRPCDQEGETPLPPEFAPLRLTPDMHKRWYNAIRAKISVGKDGGKEDEGNSPMDDE